MTLYFKKELEKNRAFILPVSINETGIDIVGTLHSSDWLETHTRGLVWHNIYQPVLKLVARQVGTHKSWRVGLCAGQTLKQKEKRDTF